MTYPRYEFFVRYMICVCFRLDFDLPVHFLSFFHSLAALCGIWDLSPPAWDQSCAANNQGTES